MTDAIGGYFGMEELSGKCNSFIHEGGVLLNLGRNAFKYILCAIPDRVNKLYMPYYTCPVMWHGLTFIDQLSIMNGTSIIKELQFYHIDKNLAIVEDIELGEHDYIVVNNYFGIKDQYIEQLSKKYGNHLIIDNAQAFFAPVIPDTYAFYSPRKFFGVPDGGVAYVANNAKPVRCEEQDESSDRLRHLHLRKEQGAEAGFATYHLNESKLDNLLPKLMSDYTHEILCGIDYATAKEKRRANFRMLLEALGEMNALQLPSIDTFACPMVYPLIPKQSKVDLRKKLQEQRIYTATYWPNLAKLNNDRFEDCLAKNLIPLPIDQRYGEEDMKRIIEACL
jgi:hypothetical protein